MASHAAPLLDFPQSPSTKHTITTAFWGHGASEALCWNDFEAYWRFYTKECELALRDRGSHVFVRTHQDIIDIVAQLHERRSKEDLRDALRPRLSGSQDNEDDIIDASIDLAARLLAMVQVGWFGNCFSGSRQLRWSKGTLYDCLQSYFFVPPSLGHEGVKLGKIFNALNLSKIAGVTVVPTSNLLDHLRLLEDDSKLCVFHHASFLQCQLPSPLFPDGLVEETLRTISLLFPHSDPATRKWYRQLPFVVELDPQLIQCPYLKTDDRQIENFYFWHDRLVILKQVFDDATPRTMSQWWHDRRNGVQWYTFWVAITVLALTLLFGLIQSVEGAMQVYGTLRSSPAR